MKMTLKSHVAASPAEVFAAYTDFERAPERVEGIQSIQMLTDGPVGAGTKFRETRIMFKREATEEMEITVFDPPREYTIEADSCGAHFATHFRFMADGKGGTDVTMDVRSKATSFGAKLFTPLGWLFGGMMKKAMQKDLDDLKKYLEQGAPAATS